MRTCSPERREAAGTFSPERREAVGTFSPERREAVRICSPERRKRLWGPVFLRGERGRGTCGPERRERLRDGAQAPGDQAGVGTAAELAFYTPGWRPVRSTWGPRTSRDLAGPPSPGLCSGSATKGMTGCGSLVPLDRISLP